MSIGNHHHNHHRYDHTKALIIITAIALIPLSSCLQCKNEDGQLIDWYISYKLPKEERRYKSNGLDLVYLMKGITNSGWKQSKYLVNDTRSLIGQTLSPLYQVDSIGGFNDGDDELINYLLYSDQPHSGDSLGEGGHAKGVLVFNQLSGFWLIHSVPSFPADPHSRAYDYPSSGTINGQIFLCLSFDTKSSLATIIEQLLFIRPHIYGQSVSSSMTQQYPDLANILAKKWIKGPLYRQVEMTTLGGEKLISFGKSPAIHLDIYSELVAPRFKTNLLAETWRKGSGSPLPSACNLTYQVNNVDQVSIQFDQQNVVWSYTEDHSKWAISSDDDGKNVACVGDINRMQSQFKRGGGAVCLTDPVVWKTLKNSIQQVEPCPKVNSGPIRKRSLIARVVNFFTNIFTSKFSLPIKVTNPSKLEFR